MSGGRYLRRFEPDLKSDFELNDSQVERLGLGFGFGLDLDAFPRQDPILQRTLSSEFSTAREARLTPRSESTCELEPASSAVSPPSDFSPVDDLFYPVFDLAFIPFVGVALEQDLFEGEEEDAPALHFHAVVHADEPCAGPSTVIAVAIAIAGEEPGSKARKVFPLHYTLFVSVYGDGLDGDHLG